MDDKEFWRSEKVAFLALASVKGVGFWTIQKIAQSGAGYKDLLKEPEKAGLDKIFREAGFDGLEGQEKLWNVGLASARNLAASAVVLLFKNEPSFPSKLRKIPDAPEWLFVQGNVENLEKHAVAIVGTRKPSDDGLFLTRYVVSSLAKSGFVTVSGLALGIDQIAHSESVRYQLPTIAVLGTGILQNYPKGSEPLRLKILQAGGTVITEYLPEQSYSAENFVRRNRLQAALGDILIPAEWQIKSGTAHTVKFAHKYEKRIINVYLPGTMPDKPELDFSANSYGAINLQIPFDTNKLMNEYNLISNSKTQSEIAQSIPTEITTPVDESVSSSSNTVDSSENSESGQLPLI
ncbi:DNA-processing protein DprA [Pseudomonas sp. TMP9]|uniref:DNA-processing protein DprA n=1 Tax=Pseudomonas sp. TMP9 TaxID=3133144 RepID=UPI0030CCD0EC